MRGRVGGEGGEERREKRGANDSRSAGAEDFELGRLWWFILKRQTRLISATLL